jgi:hypothetical protein
VADVGPAQPAARRQGTDDLEHEQHQRQRPTAGAHADIVAATAAGVIIIPVDPDTTGVIVIIPVVPDAAATTATEPRADRSAEPASIVAAGRSRGRADAPAGRRARPAAP